MEDDETKVEPEEDSKDAQMRANTRDAQEETGDESPSSQPTGKAPQNSGKFGQGSTPQKNVGSGFGTSKPPQNAGKGYGDKLKNQAKQYAEKKAKDTTQKAAKKVATKVAQKVAEETADTALAAETGPLAPFIRKAIEVAFMEELRIRKALLKAAFTGKTEDLEKEGNKILRLLLWILVGFIILILMLLLLFSAAFGDADNQAKLAGLTISKVGPDQA